MPDYSFIARGLPPIDIASPLMQVESMRRARAEDQRAEQRNALFAASEQRQAQQFETAQASSQAQAQVRQQIPQFEAAAASGSLPDYLRSIPEMAQFADAAGNPEFVGALRNILYQQAGMEAPKQEPIGSLHEVVGPSGPVLLPARQAAGMRPYDKPSSPQVSVNLGDNEWEKGLAKSQVEAYTKILDAGKASDKAIARLDRMGQLMEGVETGALAPAKAEVAAIAESLGFKIDPNLDAAQALTALSNEMALELRNPSGGAGMPGAMSDADRQYLAQMVAGLGKTKGANKLIMETARKMRQRDKDVAFMARDYVQRKGRLDEGFYDELARFSAQNPMFAEPGSQQAQQPVQVQSIEEALKLPPSTPFLTPDGRPKVRP